MKKSAGDDVPQAELIQRAREKLGKTNAEIADELGVTVHAVRAWIAPQGTKKHRAMPKPARLLLAAILENARPKRRR